MDNKNERMKFFAQNFGGIYTGSIEQTVESKVTPNRTLEPKQAAPGLFDKIGKVFGSAAKLGAQAVGKAAGYVGNTAIDVGGSALGVGRTLRDLVSQPLMLGTANKMLASLDEKQKRVNDAWNAGNLSKEDYSRQLQEIREARYEINDKFLDPITKGPTAQERAEDIVDTTVNVLTLGRWTPVKSAVFTTKNAALNKSLNKAVETLDNTILRIPAAKELVARNTAAIAKREAQRAAGETMEQYMVREGRRVAVGLLVKRPLFYQMNIDDATNVYNGMMNGDYGEAAKSAGWMALQMVGGGPVGWFMRTGKAAGVKLRDLAYGRQSFIDKLSAQIGNGNQTQIARHLNTLKQKAPKEFERAEHVLRIMQETNLRVANERVGDAVENVLRNYDQAGIARENISPQTFVNDYERWHEAAQLADGLKGRTIKGLDEDQVNNLVVVRWDSVMKRGLATAIEEAGDNRQAMAEVLDDFAGRTMNGWGNNPLLMGQLTRIVDEAMSASEAAKRIKAIPTATAIPDGIPKGVAKQLANLGYGVAVPLGGKRRTPIVQIDETRRLVSGAIKGDREIFDPATEPKPILNAIAGALDKIGLSPQGVNEVANEALNQALVAGLSDLGLTQTFRMVGEDTSKGAAAIMSQLKRYVEAKKPLPVLGKISSGKSAVIDVRMLTPTEIQEALGGISKQDAKDVQKAILDAYTKVPLELRGLGERAVDYAFKYNPAQKYYARIQSALRYTYNPFFRFQEQVETAALTKMNADKFLWLKSKKELSEGVDKLAKAGYFDGNLMSEAANDVVFGRISANLTKFQKRNLAGLAYSMAERKGISLDKMITEYGEELDDAMKVIVQYPNKGALASPLARTLNIAVFPMRYNAKLGMMAAKKIAELPPSLQLATIQSFFKAKDWLQSDEGIRWQSEHSDAIQILKWATPYGSIESLYKVLTGSAEGAAEWGLLGGLPFGVIGQMLDGQGIIQMNTPYVNPATGDLFPRYVPQTTKARAAVALQDFVNTLFSYPGRTLGMPGKRETLRKMSEVFIETNGEDFDKRLDTDKLTPLQKKWIRVLKGDVSDEAVDGLFTSPAEGQFQYYTLPPMDLPETTKVPNTVPVLSKSEVKARSGQRQSSQDLVARPIERP